MYWTKDNPYGDQSIEYEYYGDGAEPDQSCGPWDRRAQDRFHEECRDENRRFANWRDSNLSKMNPSPVASAVPVDNALLTLVTLANGRRFLCGVHDSRELDPIPGTKAMHVVIETVQEYEKDRAKRGREP